MEFEDYLKEYKDRINKLINYKFDYIDNKDYIKSTAYILFYKLCSVSEYYEEGWLSYMFDKKFYDELFKTVIKNIYMLDYSDRVKLSKKIVFLINTACIITYFCFFNIYNAINHFFMRMFRHFRYC